MIWSKVWSGNVWADTSPSHDTDLHTRHKSHIFSHNYALLGLNFPSHPSHLYSHTHFSHTPHTNTRSMIMQHRHIPHTLTPLQTSCSDWWGQSVCSVTCGGQLLLTMHINSHDHQPLVCRHGNEDYETTFEKYLKKDDMKNTQHKNY